MHCCACLLRKEKAGGGVGIQDMTQRLFLLVTKQWKRRGGKPLLQGVRRRDSGGAGWTTLAVAPRTPALSLRLTACGVWANIRMWQFN